MGTLGNWVCRARVLDQPGRTLFWCVYAPVKCEESKKICPTIVSDSFAGGKPRNALRRVKPSAILGTFSAWSNLC